MGLTLKDCVEGFQGLYVGPHTILDRPYCGVSIDSRKECYGRVFVALRGDKWDGHSFVSQALLKGSPLAVVERQVEAPHILVSDAVSALQSMAAYLLRKWQPIVVAVTGSSGKTTTKELIARLLGETFRVHKALGNYNNLIGLPYTVANMDPNTQVAVLEMGTNAPGEIALLCSIARPHIGVLTNVGRAHLGPLNGINGVKKAKGEMLHGMRADGLLVYNADDPSCEELAGEFPKTLSFGLEKGDVRARDISLECIDSVWVTSFTIVIGGGEHRAVVPLPGMHHVYNALASVAVALELGVPLDRAVETLGQFSGVDMRMNVKSWGECLIIDDTYNANPDSTWWALKTLGLFPAARRLALLGSMLELGDEADRWHRWIGREAVSAGVEWVGTLGEEARVMAQEVDKAGVEAHHFENHAEASCALAKILKAGDILLVKGSRGMKMELVLEALRSE